MSESEYDSDDRLLTEEVYLSFLRTVRNEYNEFGADESMFKELNLLVEEILRRWYDDNLKKVYDEYIGEEDKMIETLMDKAEKWLESRI